MKATLQVLVFLSILSVVFLKALRPNQEEPETAAAPNTLKDLLHHRVKRQEPEKKIVTVKHKKSGGCHVSTCVGHHLIHALHQINQDQQKDPHPPQGLMDKYGK